MNIDRPVRLKLDDTDRIRKFTYEQNNARGIVFTPLNIVEDMLNEAPKKLWSNPETRVLNICSKNGIFLDRMYWRFENGLCLNRKFNETYDMYSRHDHILLNQLYGLSLDEHTANITRNVLYGQYMANSDLAFTRGFTNKEGNIYTLNDKEKLGDMKFDLVIGNPPYNKGMDIDFVDMAFELSSRYVIMITPAKWQTAEPDQQIASKMSYGEFRNKIVPHMKKVVFYPDCGDIFNIYQMDGISYYIIDKNNVTDKCHVVNKCKCQPYFNSEAYRDIKNGNTLHNIGNKIMEYLGNYKVWTFPNVVSNTYEVWSNTKLAKGNHGIIGNDGNTLCLSMSYLIDKSKGESSPSEESKCIFSSNSKEECESFLSWINCKFTRFFVLMNISKLNNIWTNHYFRFVPAPPSGKFDHIYTDKELYDAFSLPDEYIKVIEAVIKERKSA